MKRSILTIAFDDGYLDSYKHAIRYLDRSGIKCTFAVPAGLIGKTCENRPVIDWQGLKEMRKKGHDVASHTLHHVNLSRKTGKLTIGTAKKEIIDSSRILEKHLPCQISSFVYPYLKKAPAENIHETVKKVYASSRLSQNTPVFNNLPLINSFHIRGFCITQRHSLKFLEKQIEKALNTGTWLIEVFHLVGTKNTKSAHRNAPYRFFMPIDKFKKHIDHVLSRKIPVLTQKTAIMKYADTKQI